MRMSVLSLAAVLTAFAFGAEAAPIGNPEVPARTGLVQKADYWCGPGWRMTRRGVCVPRYRRPPPPAWGWGPPPPRWGPPPRHWRHHHHRRHGYWDRPRRHWERRYWD